MENAFDPFRAGHASADGGGVLDDVEEEWPGVSDAFFEELNSTLNALELREASSGGGVSPAPSSVTGSAATNALQQSTGGVEPSPFHSPFVDSVRGGAGGEGLRRPEPVEVIPPDAHLDPMMLKETLDAASAIQNDAQDWCSALTVDADHTPRTSDAGSSQSQRSSRRGKKAAARGVEPDAATSATASDADASSAAMFEFHVQAIQQQEMQVQMLQMQIMQLQVAQQQQQYPCGHTQQQLWVQQQQQQQQWQLLHSLQQQLTSLQQIKQASAAGEERPSTFHLSALHTAAAASMKEQAKQRCEQIRNAQAQALAAAAHSTPQPAAGRVLGGAKGGGAAQSKGRPIAAQQVYSGSVLRSSKFKPLPAANVVQLPGSQITVGVNTLKRPPPSP